jgi:hypothetical protein
MVSVIDVYGDFVNLKICRFNPLEVRVCYECLRGTVLILN